MSRETAHTATPLTWMILGLVLVFGVVQLYFWTDRSIWIDEVSQLINFPLDNLAQAFGPLPEAQQAGPPVFNLMLHAISGLPLTVLRIIIITLTLGVVLAALIGAFGKRPLPIAAGLFVLLSHQPFLINASMLKFYAFDIIGFAIFAAWIYAKNRDEAFNLRDVAVLLVGLLAGVSTIVGGCIVVGVFLFLRLLRKQLGIREIVYAGMIGVIAVAYYLQISYATSIQITAFPDAYGKTGMAAEWSFLHAASQLFQRRGLVLLILLSVLAVGSLLLLKGEARSKLAGLMLFAVTIFVVFLGLAAIGKYPAVSSRHLLWMLGIYPIFAAAVFACLAEPGTQSRRPLAIGGMIVLAFLFVGIGARTAMKWPPQIVEGASDQLVSTLADLPPSPVVKYFGSFRLIPLKIEKGAPITQHTYAPALSTKSGVIDPSYFAPEWYNMDDDRYSEEIIDLLRNDQIGWAKMYVISRIRGDFRPLARFALDAAPNDGTTFYVTAIHASWPGSPGRATAGLRDVLDERSCTYEPLATFHTLLSPGYVLQANCP